MAAPEKKFTRDTAIGDWKKRKGFLVLERANFCPRERYLLRVGTQRSHILAMDSGGTALYVAVYFTL